MVWRTCLSLAVEAPVPPPNLPQHQGPRTAPEPYSLAWVWEGRSASAPLQFSEEGDAGSNILNHVTNYGMNQTIYLTSIMEPKLFREGRSRHLASLPLSPPHYAPHDLLSPAYYESLTGLTLIISIPSPPEFPSSSSSTKLYSVN